MEVLSEFQQTLLRHFAKNPILKDYYLTGGTALSAYYLKHRFSEDLDFFTEVPQGVSRAETLVQEAANSMGLTITMGRRFQTLFECSLSDGAGEKIELDFALDMPGRLQPIHQGKALGCNLDNKIDIACNKLSALYERTEPKDFVDVYFICGKFFSFDELWNNSRKKYPALDTYGMALALSKIRNITLLPRMIKPLSLEDLQDFFLKQARMMSDQI